MGKIKNKNKQKSSKNQKEGKKAKGKKKEKKRGVWDTVKHYGGKIIKSGIKWLATALLASPSQVEAMLGPHSFNFQSASVCRLDRSPAGVTPVLAHYNEPVTGLRPGSVGVGDAIPLASGFEVVGPGGPLVAQQGDTYVIAHGDMLQPLQIPAGTLLGDSLVQVEITPRLGLWLAKMANFQKYRVKAIVVEYIPMVAMTQAGGIVGVYEWDIDSTMKWGLGQSSLDRAMAIGAKLCDVKTAHIFSFTDPESPWLYTSSAGHEPRTAVAGKFTIAAAADFAGALAAGQMRVGYIFEFRHPDPMSNPIGSYECEIYNSSPPEAKHAKPGVIYDKWNPRPDLDTRFTPGIALTMGNYFKPHTWPDVSDGSTGRTVAWSSPQGYYHYMAAIAGSDIGTTTVAAYGKYATLDSNASWIGNPSTEAVIVCGAYYSSGLSDSNDNGVIPANSMVIKIAVAAADQPKPQACKVVDITVWIAPISSGGYPYLDDEEYEMEVMQKRIAELERIIIKKQQPAVATSSCSSTPLRQVKVRDPTQFH